MHYVVVNYAHAAGPAQGVIEAIQALPGSPRAIAIQADVTKPSEVTQLFEKNIGAL